MATGYVSPSYPALREDYQSELDESWTVPGSVLQIGAALLELLAAAAGARVVAADLVGAVSHGPIPHRDGHAIAMRHARRHHISKLRSPIAEGPTLLDINPATAEQLEALPGIGPVRSQQIVEAREADGPFATTDDLLTRGVLSEFVYAGLRDLIVAR